MPDDLLLQTPHLADGLRRIHYFNGRVLTAEDLAVEQHALVRRDRRLGRALGAGVVAGFEVHASDGPAPAVEVRPGLALNAEGEPLELARPVTVRVAPRDEAAPAEDALFVRCPGASGGVTVPVGTGAYVLTVAPAAGGEGMAPRVGLGDGGVARSCGTRFVVEGVQFRLLDLDLEDAALWGATLAEPIRTLAARPARTAPEDSRLRSLLAHGCLGTAEIAGFPHVHFDGGAPPEGWAYGALDRLLDAPEDDPNRPAPCEVPLALLFWHDGRVEWVDRWAVRRRAAAPPSQAGWAPHVGARRVAEAEAAWLQFQEHLAALVGAGVNTRFNAAEAYFAFLPPGGYVPARDGSAGEFFGSFQTWSEGLDEALVRQHLFASWLEEPIALLGGDRPPLTLYAHPDYVIFRRGSVGREVDAAAEPEAPAETPAPRGVIEVGIEGSREEMAAFAAAYKRGAAGITVRNVATGGQHALRPATTAGIRSKDVFDPVGTGRGTQRATLTTGPVPAGAYVVSLTEGRKAPRQQRVTVGRGAARVTFQLGRGGTKPTRPGLRPDRVVDVGPAFDGRFGKGVLVDERVGPVWPPRDDPRWEHVDPLVNPPPDVLAWAERWGGWVQETVPEAAVDTGDVRVYVDPAYDPEGVAEAPYAYVVWGARGAYAPLLLTAADRTLERAVPTSGTLLPGGAGAATGAVEHLDAVAAGWTGLVAESLGVTEETAAGLIEDARAEVDDRRGSLRVFSGVDAGLEAALAEAGFADALALANASPDALLEVPGMTRSLARVLVDQARQVVPVGGWDLGGGGVGLAAGVRADLAGLGIRTVGDFRAAAGDPGRRGQVRTALGVSEDALAALEGSLDEGFSGLRLRLAGGGGGAAPVTRLPGVDRDAASALDRAGIRTVSDLAGAEHETVARALGEASAAVVRAEAAAAAPAADLPEVAPEAAVALRRSGIRTVGALAGADAEALAPAFGGRAAAEAAIVQARGRLGRP